MDCPQIYIQRFDDCPRYYPPKQAFFSLSEGLSEMTDPELRGKTRVFPFPHTTP